MLFQGMSLGTIEYFFPQNNIMNQSEKIRTNASIKSK